MGFLHYVKFFVIICFTVGVGSFASAALILHMQGYQVLSVQTGSMTPAFAAGDAVVVHKANVSELRVGEIVSYHSPADPRVVVSHRLVSIDYITGRLITKGDHNDLQDIPFPSNQVIGQVVGIVPHFGRVLDWLHEPAGLIVLIYTPAAFILVSEARRLSRVYEKPFYQFHNL